MGNIFSIKEVIDIAIEIEKNGKNFYHQMLNKVKDEKAQEIFEYLEEEEEKHIKTFEKILMLLKSETDIEIDTSTLSDEYYDYLKALSDEHIFTKQKAIEFEKMAVSDLQAIELAIGMEKDSILFYDEIKKIVKEKERDLVDKIIEQEKTHLYKLTSLKNILLKIR
ncbi:MAG TPA: ferritin family protein [bacterium]|nr:ferritin family protein [bacterium]HPQ19911.1 ferritin family protein [bacterium]